jgi:hypothetical protein
MEDDFKEKLNQFINISKNTNDNGVIKLEWTCSRNRLVLSQVLHFFRLKPCKNAILRKLF